MKILVSNDDGIFAPGIAALVRALDAAGHEVYVCAPDSQRSAASHSLTISKPMTVKPEAFDGAKEAYAIGGTPADCVKIGLEKLCPQAEAVISGINRGYNAGSDILYSGTVGAAMEGALCGRQAIAVSIHHTREDNYDQAAQLALEGLSLIGRQPLPRYAVLNLNYPAADRALGLKAARMAPLHYVESYIPCEMPDGTSAYRLGGEPDLSRLYPDSDFELLCRGYATATVLTYNMTDERATKTIEALI